MIYRGAYPWLDSDASRPPALGSLKSCLVDPLPRRALPPPIQKRSVIVDAAKNAFITVGRSLESHFQCLVTASPEGLKCDNSAVHRQKKAFCWLSQFQVLTAAAQEGALLSRARLKIIGEPGNDAPDAHLK
jgi:hypothetical protein